MSSLRRWWCLAPFKWRCCEVACAAACLHTAHYASPQKVASPHAPRSLLPRDAAQIADRRSKTPCQPHNKIVHMELEADAKRLKKLRRRRVEKLTQQCACRCCSSCFQSTPSSHLIIL